MTSNVQPAPSLPRRPYLYALPDLGRPLRYGAPSLVRTLQAASQQALDAMAALDLAVATIGRELGRDGTLLCTPLGIVVSPHAPTCVAMTTWRRRCPNLVFGDGHPWLRATLAVLDPLATGFPSQLCAAHRQDPPARTMPVEWVLVDDEPARWAHLIDID
jgi:hypothetical protein